MRDKHYNKQQTHGIQVILILPKGSTLAMVTPHVLNLPKIILVICFVCFGRSGINGVVPDMGSFESSGCLVGHE